MKLQLINLLGTPVFTLKSHSLVFEKVYGGVYHGPTRSWRFPAFYPVHTLVLQDLKKVFPGVEISKEIAEHIRSIENLTIPNEYTYLTVPYKHQIDGVAHLYKNPRSGLFYAPGLGKCKVTVDLLRLTGEPCLILCPRVMLYDWAAEFVKHGNITDVAVIDADSKAEKLEEIAQAVAKTPAATIVTYATAARYVEQLVEIKYTCIVADESHQIKSPHSDRTKAALTLSRRASRRVILSGTPSLGSPFDMYSQMRFLGKFFCHESWWEFKAKFGVFMDAERKMLKGYKNLNLINERVTRVCLRKTKEECLDLPEQTIVNIKFGLYAEQKNAYNNLIRDKCDTEGFVIRRQIEELKLDNLSGPTLKPHVLTTETITLLGKLDQISSGFIYQSTQNPKLCDRCLHVNLCVAQSISPYTPSCKVVQKAPTTVTYEFEKNARLDTLQDLLETLVQDAANKVIIWAYYAAELEHIVKLVQSLKLGFVKVQGGMSAKSLQEQKETFNNDAKCRVYVAQVSTGIGITLNAANYVVYYSLPWSLEHYLQSLDRNYRIGQSRNVTVYRLIGHYTLDEAKIAALDQKMDFSNLITNRTPCVTCKEFAKRCAPNNIDLYDEACIYDRTMQRHTADIRLIP